MRASSILAVVLLAACAPAGAPGAAAPTGPGLGGPRAGPPPGLAAGPDRNGAPSGQAAEGCARNTARFDALVGASPGAARASLLAMPGIGQVRVAGPDDAVTQDFQPDRATVRTRGGRVERIDCG